MTAEEMNDLFDSCIGDYHKTDHVNAGEPNPFEKGSFKNLLYHKNWIDTVQWHLEDLIRDPEIDPENALALKRRIDASNQLRTDVVEKIDDFYLEMFSKVQFADSAKLNTESPAWAIDRLSILALKIYHMEIEAGREDTEPALAHKNQHKLATLREQRADLSLAINQLLDDLTSGKRKMKVYRQMKMYNDPDLNPVLYAQKKL